MTFYFYDLETSGINPRRDRIMQFAGQRTDENLQAIGERDNIMIKLTPDTLPQPEAILVTGITPQSTVVNGITEAEFLKYFAGHINVPDTMIVGFNNVRFDDEFMRFMLWRNFYDAYEWQWKKGCSRWDLLDVVRMTRALRPEGIKWPFAPDGKPSNRLELLSSVNKLEHVNAHDAMSDVTAAIDVARLIKEKQPKLFSYLLNMRSKQKVAALVGQNQPFVYSSGRYPAEFEKTAAVIRIADQPGRNAAVVYDLRIDPAGYINLKPEELAAQWGERGKDAPYFPLKVLSYNKCPAVAPLNVVDEASEKRLGITRDGVSANQKVLASNPDFRANVAEALRLIEKKYQKELLADPDKADENLYDGFVEGSDKVAMAAVRTADKNSITGLELDFEDARLAAIFPLYKARNYPQSLSDGDRTIWEAYLERKLFKGGENSVLADYLKRLSALGTRSGLSENDKYLLEELRLWAESLVPVH